MSLRFRLLTRLVHVRLYEPLVAIEFHQIENLFLSRRKQRRFRQRQMFLGDISRNRIHVDWFTAARFQVLDKDGLRFLGPFLALGNLSVAFASRPEVDVLSGELLLEKFLWAQRI